MPYLGQRVVILPNRCAFARFRSRREELRRAVALAEVGAATSLQQLQLEFLSAIDAKQQPWESFCMGA